MVSNSLRQFLKSLCCNSPWDYAVFWRLQQHQSQMLLIWEDGSFDISRPREPTGDIMGPFYFNWSDEGLSSCQLGNENGNLSDAPLGIMMAEMSRIYYIMGKGIVGEVAYSESRSWIFADSTLDGGCSFNSISECPEDLLYQFVAGIKTVLLVPLVPFGVLQLGSRDKVAEDAGWITWVKNKFDAHQQFAGDFTPFRSDRKSIVQPPEVKYTYMESLGELSGIAISKMDEDLKILDSIGVRCPETLNSNEIQMTSMVQNVYEIYQKDMSEVTDSESESKINIHSVGFFDVAEPLLYPMVEYSDSGMTQNILRSSYVDEELEAFSFFGDCEMAHQDITVHKIMESYLNEGTMELPFEKENYDDITCKSESQFLTFPSDCELHNALGSVLWDYRDLNLFQLASSEENSAKSSISRQDTVHYIQPLACDSGRGAAEGKKAEYLLDAVIGNASVSDDSSYNRSYSPTTSVKTPSGIFASLKTEEGSLARDDQVPQSCVTSAPGKDSRMKIATSTSSLDCMISALLEHRSQGDGNSKERPTKRDKPTGGNKRKLPRNSHKPRPRDRQLIQERIKELRELVPSGSKCSIDGLLDRTIKHMQFLRRVTDQADTIKQHLLNENSDRKESTKGSTQRGTSWALELGPEQQTCPIVVKDLEHQGHMLIEMSCDDHGRFLEIADVICRLQLTVLQGVMERRSDGRTWAHFVVETSKDFHRLDIFWPLMQLLQRNQTQISSKI